MAPKKEDVIPTGSRAPEEPSGQTQLPGMETSKTGSSDTGGDEGGKDEKDTDKFEGKSREDVIKSYSELETKIGTQGDELGKIREDLKSSQSAQQQMSGQIDGMKSMVSDTGKEKEPGRNFDADLAQITKAIDEGEMELSEGIRQSSEITRERTLGEARQIYSELDQEREASRTINDFKKTTDFEEVRASGKLDAFKQQNSMHDDFSAYYALKAQRAEESGKAAVEEAYQKGLTEKQNLAAGTEVADSVLKKPGSEMRQTTTPQGPLTGDQRRGSMLDALKRSREQ